MPYQATHDVVERVMPLLRRLGPTSLDQARLLQYLSARIGVAWDVLELIGERDDEPAPGATGKTLLLRDRVSGQEHEIRYPACLPVELDRLVQEEYTRLAVARPLTTMAEPLFAALFEASHCRRCRWRGPEHAQIHRECRYAGHPVNFEPVPTS